LPFNREVDCLAAKLRPGNVNGAEGWEDMLLAEIERQQRLGKEVVFRADAAFAKPEIYESLEERGVKYAVHLPANDGLERNIAELLTRPLGRSSHEPVVWYKSLLHQAASWNAARRAVAKVEFHFGELFPRVGFVVTNLETDSRAVVRFYNRRGTAGQWIKEGKQAVKMARLSCHRFQSNEVRPWLSVLAYNLGNPWPGRPLGRALPKRIENWSLTSLQQRLVKTGGRLIKHARHYWLMLAESHLTRRLFASMVWRIAALAVATGWAAAPLEPPEPFGIGKMRETPPMGGVRSIIDTGPGWQNGDPGLQRKGPFALALRGRGADPPLRRESGWGCPEAPGPVE
jgi:hypothetical protein